MLSSVSFRRDWRLTFPIGLALLLSLHSVRSSREVLEHPYLVNPTVASFVLLLLPASVATGAFAILALRSVGLRAMVSGGSNRLVSWLRLSWPSFAATVVIPLMLQFAGLLLSGALFRGLSWVIYGSLVLSFAMLGLALGVALGIMLDVVVRPANFASAALMASALGIATFVGLVSISPAGDTSTVMNFAVLADSLPAYLELRPEFLLVQQIVALGAVAIICGGLSLCLSPGAKKLFGAAALSIGISTVAAGGNIELQDRIFRPVVAEKCTDGPVPVCYVPLDFRAASLLAEPLRRIHEAAPELLPIRVVQSPGRPQKGSLNVLRLPDSRDAAILYSAQLALASAGCEPAEVMQQARVKSTFEAMQAWLLSDEPPPASLKEALTNLGYLCA